ncbi:MAG: cytochrome c oxidase subunit II [Micromonosporaceae bacterium]
MEFRRVFGQVFGLEATIASVVFGLVMLGIVAALLLSWHRRRRGRPASRRSKHNRLELAYVLTLIGMAIFLVTLSFGANARESHDPQAPLTVRVTGYQWCWGFTYAGHTRVVNGQCAGGPLPTLVLPAGRPVRIEVTSKDVVHAFWVPALRYKIDAFPGHVNDLTFTLPRSGRWIGRCAEFCGQLHYEMDFYLKAVPAAEFDRWLHSGGSVAVSGA